MLPESEVTSAVGERASLLTLNAGALENRVKSNPWVQSAAVSKDWDSSIVTVQVEERRAVLNALVEGEREIYAVDGNRLPGTGEARLPEISLDRGQVNEVLSGVRAIERSGLSVSLVNSVDAAGVNLTVNQKPVVFSGEVPEEQAAALANIMESSPDAGYFDIRSSERVVVGLDEEPEE